MARSQNDGLFFQRFNYKHSFMPLRAHVKHFLNAEGKKKFSSWFAATKEILHQQVGFIRVTYAYDPIDEDCINLWIDFANEKTLEKWSATVLHRNIVAALDCYRIKPWVSVRYQMRDE